MNLFSILMMLSLTMLIVPILMTIPNTQKHISYPTYMNSMTSYFFTFSLFLVLMFIYSEHKAMVSNWHWMTIQTMKLSLSFKLDYFSLMFMPVALFVAWSIMVFNMMYTNSSQHWLILQMPTNIPNHYIYSSYH